MNIVLLINAIVRQTTVLIAQLSTAAGVRAPLADVADQVFLQLARDIEAQGVPRKVVADMFGLALRGYQKKVQRLTESATQRETTLWQAVLDRLNEAGSQTRHEMFQHFVKDDPDAIAAVLNDLVNSGLSYRTGSGPRALYGVTREQDYARLLKDDDVDSAAALVWVGVYRNPNIGKTALARNLGLQPALLDRALESLLAQGRIQEQAGGYRADSVSIPVGTSQGWEAAVLDHYQAMVTAIAAKLQHAARSDAADVIGGATLSFDVHDEHPQREEVYGLLRKVRADINALWERVVEHNAAHPVAEERRQRVAFYFGQSVTRAEDET